MSKHHPPQRLRILDWMPRGPPLWPSRERGCDGEDDDGFEAEAGGEAEQGAARRLISSLRPLGGRLALLTMLGEAVSRACIAHGLHWQRV